MDGTLFCVVPAETIHTLRLEVGGHVSSESLNRLEAAASRAAALEQALRLLGFRARSRIELERRLRRSGHPPDAIDAALARCGELGYLDDQAFALSFARDRLNLRPCGRRLLMTELRRKGVAQDAAASAIEEAFAEADLGEAEFAQQLAHRRLRSIAGLTQPVARRRLTAYLARRGFPPAIIQQAVQSALADLPTN